MTTSPEGAGVARPRAFTPFQRRFRSQAVRLLLAQKRPFFYVLTYPGFTYVGLGPVAAWRVGWWVGLRWRPRGR
jgi:hypothetical protein